MSYVNKDGKKVLSIADVLKEIGLTTGILRVNSSFSSTAEAEEFMCASGWTAVIDTEPQAPTEEQSLHTERVLMQVSRRQAMRMLHDVGLLDAVNDYVSTLSVEDQIDYAAAGTFKRLHPLIDVIIPAISEYTPTDIDNWFRQAPILYK